MSKKMSKERSNFQNLVEFVRNEKVEPSDILGGFCVGHKTICRYLNKEMICEKFGNLKMSNEDTPIKTSYCHTVMGIKRSNKRKKKKS